MVHERSIFIGIGAAKAGSTWLANYLWKHEQVFLSPTKGLRYFDQKYGRPTRQMKLTIPHVKALIKYSLESPFTGTQLLFHYAMLLCRFDGAYRRYLLAGNSKKRAVGEISVTYCGLSRDTFRIIDRLVPESRFIFIVRNPTDLLWSSARFIATKRRGNPSAVQLIDDPIFIQKQATVSNYGRTIRDLKEIVGNERLLVVFFENLFSDSGEEECKKICNFIGVDYDAPELENKINSSPASQMNPEIRRTIIKQFADVYEYMAKSYPDSYPESWKRDYAYLTPIIHDGHRI